MFFFDNGDNIYGLFFIFYFLLSKLSPAFAAKTFSKSLPALDFYGMFKHEKNIKHSMIVYI